MITISERLAQELAVQTHQIQAAIQLLDNGASVPFIARYRKEMTEGLTDTQLRTLEERLRYLRELEERREVILNSIREQNKLTAELEVAIREAETKTRLEDLYLPYKPKRRTKAQIAREAGLQPLALDLLKNPLLIPEKVATAYLDVEKGIEEVKQALEGARQILMERFSEEADLLEQLREYIWQNATLSSRLAEGKEEEGAKFADYFDFHEPLKDIPSHRALALFRGRKEGILHLSLIIDSSELNKDNTVPGFCENSIARYFNIENQARPADTWLLETVRLAWRFKIRLHLDTELMMRLRETAEAEAIKVFARNLQDLLLAAPAGPRTTIGLDPGLRTGVKAAVIDKTGKVLDTAVISNAPKAWPRAMEELEKLAREYKAELISIGNGTGVRETDRLITDFVKKYPGLNLQKLIVSEAGASVYSASEIASQELPELDVSLRGAVSIARRLQDPLAELVKIDPKSIGVGQYQHDVNQSQLAHTLDAVVEDCVNAVGVDVNTASASLLSRVSGLSASLARNIVAFRNEHGSFPNREVLKKIPRLGEKTFEQAAGFLRIPNGDNPLDASTVHPEAYPVVQRIVEKFNRSVKSLIGDTTFLRKLVPADFTDDIFGIPTVIDILSELEKPGRDPRPEFKTASFKEGIESMEDLQVGMILEGFITNVTNFGAFVDIGIHQDGLIHISALSYDYVKEPREVVKAGDIVKVKVVEVDLKRRRVSLTMRLEEHPTPVGVAAKKKEKEVVAQTVPAKVSKPEKKERQPALAGAMAAAFANARKRLN